MWNRDGRLALGSKTWKMAADGVENYIEFWEFWGRGHKGLVYSAHRLSRRYRCQIAGGVNNLSCVTEGVTSFLTG
jgi:hypothetical protein